MSASPSATALVAPLDSPDRLRRLAGWFGTAVYVSPGKIAVKGWAADPKHPNESLTVVVVEDGKKIGTLPADLARADVATQYPKLGPNHGFQGELPTTADTKVEVCVEAVSHNSDTRESLGCRIVTPTDR